MANTLRFKRGLASGLPTGLAGEPLFTTDTFDLYIGNGTGNTRFQKYIASGTTSQLLRGDGSLLTMPIVLSSPANGEVLKYNGTNWVNSSDAGVTGSGTAGQVTYWGSANTITGSSIFTWDNTTRILQLSGSDITQIINQTNTASASAILFRENGSTRGYIQYVGSTFATAIRQQTLEIQGNNGGIAFRNSGGEIARFAITSGNLLLNSTTDNGLRFQVTGDGYFSGSVGIGTSSITAYNLRNNKNITGGTTAFGHSVDGIVQTDVTSFAIYNHTVAQTTAGGTYANLAHYNANQGGIGGTLTNQFGYRVAATLTGATNNYGFYGDIASGTGRWNLYMNGTAANYLAGNLGIGSPITTFKLSTFNAGSYTIGLLNSSIGTVGEHVGITYGFGASTYNKGAMYFISRDANGRGDFHFALNNVASAANVSTSDARMILTYEGNLGLGVTPSAWDSVYRVFQIGGNPALASQEAVQMVANGYYNAGWKYIANNYAARYEINKNNGGIHAWYNAPSGTAGNPISFVQAMTLDASGRLGIGTTNPDSKLHVLTSGPTNQFRINYNGTNDNYYDALNHYFRSGDGSQSRLILFSTGNVAIANGVDAGFRLDVNGTMRVSGASTFGTGLFYGGTSVTPTLKLQAAIYPMLDLFVDNTDTNARNWRIAGVYNSYGTLEILSSTTQGGTPTTTRFSISGVTGAATFSSSVTLSGNLTVDTNTFFVDSNNNNVGIGTTTINANEKLRLDGGRLTVLGNSEIYQLKLSYNNATSGFWFGSPSANALAFYNDAGTERARFDSSGNFGIGMTPSYKLDVTGSARVSDAIAIGTTPDTNLPFKILKNINSTVGIRFENTSTGASSFTGYQFGTDVSGGTAFTNFLYASSGVTETGVYKPNGTALINTGSGGLNFLAVSQPIRFFTSTGNGTLRAAITNDGDFTQYNGTNPSASTTDAFRMYSADITAGNAAPHFRTENGGIIKLYQQTTGVTSATYIGGAGTGLTDSDTFDGYTIAQIVKALRNAGLLA